MKLLKSTPVFLLLGLSTGAFAQPSLSKMKLQIDNEELQQPKGRSMKIINSTQAGILFKNNTELVQTNVITWLSQKLLLRQNEDQLVDENRDVVTGDNYAVKKIHQYYKGIKVEHGMINVTARNGKIGMIQLEYYSVPNGFNTRPLLSEQQAFDKATAFIGAKEYAWGDGTDTTDEDRRKPRGELVIVQTYLNENGDVCLAYKFNIYAINPLHRSYVFVNAMDGRIILDDPIIKHAKSRSEAYTADEVTRSIPKNENDYITKAENRQSPLWVDEPINNAAGSADTRYNGRRQILADHYSPVAPQPYRLRALRNNHNIIVLNYQRHNHHTNIFPSYEATAIDFTDNNNDWTAAEYHNANMDDGAIDVMDNMIWVSDYWKGIHDRNSWNNANGDVINFVHIYQDNKPYDNAYWNGKNMHFGDGNGKPEGNSQRDPVATSLDDCAHELAHGVNSSTANLLYRWESGAMNEAFSDIWAACITNYAKAQDPSISGESTWRLFEKSNRPDSTIPGLRDMKNPLIFSQPSTYHSRFWEDGDFVSCHAPDQGAVASLYNDMCGVHTNSGVLNKWFYLITDGEAGTNTKNKTYNITGLGFAVSQRIAYLMQLNLTPNAGYANAMTVSLNVTATAYGYGSTQYNTVKSAWAAVGVDTSNVYNMANTPVFTTNNFTCITAALDGYVFAGTNYSGYYQFDGTDWTKRTELTDVRFNDMKTDNIEGHVWMAQSGRQGTTGGGSSIGGGVSLLKYPYEAITPLLYTVDPTLHVPSRNARCMYVDNVRLTDAVNPKVWVATTAYITSSASTSGMLGVGLHTNVPEFSKVNEGIYVGLNTVGCLTVGGNRKEIWTFVQANNGINQLLVYNAETNALITTYDHNSVPIIPSGFVARAIYGDNFGRIWIGLAFGGVLIYDESKRWHLVNFPAIFPSGVSVNYNAITGSIHGDVYIGTTMGMAYFDAGGGWAIRLDDSLYYRLYKKSNGLVSDNINAIAYDEERFKLWVASDSGIVAWDPPCIGGYQNCFASPGTKGVYAASSKSGNWSDSTVWDSRQVPDSNTVVVIKDTITVDINGQCQSLTVTNPGNLKVNTGKDLKIFAEKEIINTNTEQRRRRRRR